MSRVATVRQAEIVRAVKAAEKAGMKVAGVEVDQVNGKIIILTATAKANDGARDAAEVVAERIRMMGAQGG